LEKQLPPLRNPLALKAVAWEFSKHMFVSPSHYEFEWTKDGLETALCRRCGEDTPGFECTCGLYATYNYGEAASYRYRSPISPILLLEAYGDYVVGGEGFRSLQLLVRAVMVDDYSPMLYAASIQAADYFDVPTMTKTQAMLIMNLWNITVFLTDPEYTEDPKVKNWREWFEPTVPELIEYPDDYLLALAKKIGGDYGNSSETQARQSIHSGVRG